MSRTASNMSLSDESQPPSNARPRTERGFLCIRFWTQPWMAPPNALASYWSDTNHDARALLPEGFAAAAQPRRPDVYCAERNGEVA
jgi:hypothetical protein